MKWTNKGHQYDELGKHFEGGKKVYIYGAGSHGKVLYSRLKFLDCVEAFVDGDKMKQECGYMDKPVISQSSLLQLQKNEVIVILAMDISTKGKGIVSVLLGSGFIWGVNLFLDSMFLELYCGIFALYGYDKLYLPSCNIYVNDICSLNCKHCSFGIPYEKNPSNRDTKDVIKSIKTLFSVVDFQDIFYVTGGEALLHPDIYEIIDFTIQNYNKQFNNLVIITNGLVKLYDSLLNLLKHPQIRIHWSDYTENLNDSKKVKIIHENVKLLTDEQIDVYSNELLWRDYGFDSLDMSELSEEELLLKYNNCVGICCMLNEKGLHACEPSQEIARRKLGLVFDDERTPLTSDNPRHKHTLLETYNGFTDKGYSELCRYCNGRDVTFSNGITPAEQLKR